MRFPSQAIVHGIQCSKGEYEGNPFDSTTFHLSVDLPQRSTGESMGKVTRPFKFGKSDEFQKWKPYKDKWPVQGVLVDCIFEMMAGAGNDSKIVLVDIKPAAVK